MIINHDYKNVIDSTTETKVGRLFYYLIDGTGSLCAIVFLDEYENKLYALGTNVTSIGDDIIITKYRKTKPTGLSECHMIYPDAIILDMAGNEYGTAKFIELEGTRILSLINGDGEIFKTENIVKSEQFYITFGEKPEPTPPKPETPGEASFNYDAILGKTATRTIYAKCNSPIIVKGEKVTVANIIAATLQCKLIELIQSLE